MPDQPPPAAPSPPPPSPEPVYVFLNLPCPTCGGRLKRPADEAVYRREGVACAKCGRRWPGYKQVFVESQAKMRPPEKPTLDKVENVLLKARAVVRGGRSVADRVRTATGAFREALAELQQFDGQESVALMGEKVEGIVEQALLAIGDIKDAKGGKMIDLPAPPERPERAERRERRRARRRRG